MPVSFAFHSALSDDWEAEYPVWRGVGDIVDDLICYELMVISIATDTSVKSYSPKWLLPLKGIPVASFHQNNTSSYFAKNCWRFLFSPTVATSSLTCLFAGYVANSKRLGFDLSASRSWFPSCSIKRWTLAAHTSNVEFSSTRWHSKSGPSPCQLLQLHL